jgi:hypothetical protein
VFTLGVEKVNCCVVDDDSMSDHAVYLVEIRSKLLRYAPHKGLNFKLMKTEYFEAFKKALAETRE